MGFTHLHLHTEYSLLDGACRINPLMEHIKSLGQTSVAITDHGVMYGAIDFYKAAKAAGIKPIIGIEAYVAEGSMKTKHGVADKIRHHLVLLCENNEGYQNLIKLVSDSFTEGFYVKPRMDKELLRKHSGGLIALSACLAGEIPTLLANDDYEGAKAVALEYNDIFGQGNFFLEVQNHGLMEEIKIIPKLQRLSEETGIPLVATNDAHYLTKEDSKVQKILVCIQTNHTIDEDTGLDFRTDEFYVKSEAEMRELFKFIPEAIENTERIAERCNVEFEFGKIKLPHFDLPNDVPADTPHEVYFGDLAKSGLKARYEGKVSSETYNEYKERMEYELSVINSMGYTDYYLIVHDFVSYAKSRGIPVGPGRGSGAGSIVAYCIGITDVDPMKYNLIFERFLNPERVSMPDFDIDFCYERRPEVIDYVIRKYGEDRVAQIVTFGTLAARAAVKDVGRVLGIPYAKVDEVSKKIPWKLGHNLKKAIAANPELQKLYDSDLQIRELIDTALKIEGMPRHTSTHAAGVVITRDAVNEYVPLAKKDDSVVTQYTMTALDELGLLKMDFLGLRTLTVVSDTEKLIKEKNPDFSVDGIDYTDKATYEMFGRGETEGVFQFESTGLRIVMTQFKPTSLEDLTALTSLYRPGPMDSIPTYIRNRHNPNLISYKTPQLENILGVTYGCLVYQEQVMQICRELAGYSLGHADIVRRAMSKKKHDVMERERTAFVLGCGERGIDEKTANSVFDDMTSFASYAFNKSHAAAYATLAFKTAYLKCHYPAEFMASQITSVLHFTDKLREYIAECNAIGIEILPPDVNCSFAKFTISDGRICFGLLAVKGLGTGFINDIVESREREGYYTSFYEFLKRVHGRNFNRKAAESLIKCGALDSLGLNRRQMLVMLPEIISEFDSDRRKNVEGQLGFFDMGNDDLSSSLSGPEFPDLPELAKTDLLIYEKETTGLYISGHPMQDYQDASKRVGSAKICELLEASEDGTTKYRDNSLVRLLAMVSDIKVKVTKSNTTMANALVEDVTGAMELTVFPKTYAGYSSILKENEVYIIEGRLSVNADEKPQLICVSMEVCSPATVAAAEQTAGRFGGAKSRASSQAPARSSAATPSVGATTPTVEAATTATATQYAETATSVGATAVLRQKRRGLFLRFTSRQDTHISECLSLLATFKKGDNPIYFFFDDEKKYSPYSDLGTLSLASGELDELRALIGEKNVALQ